MASLLTLIDTAGTSAAPAFEVIDTSGVTTIKIDGTEVTVTGAELNYLDITTLGTGAASKAVVLDSGEDYTWPATGILTYGVLKDPAGTTLGATVAEINAKCDDSARYINMGDVTTYTVAVTNSGKTIFWPDLTTDCVITLPAETAGLEYTFVYAGVTDDAADVTIDSGSNTNYFLGGIFHADSDGTTVASVVPNGSSNSKLTINDPGAGTRITLFCNGTQWIVSGFVIGATAPAYADQ